MFTTASFSTSLLYLISAKTLSSLSPSRLLSYLRFLHHQRLLLIYKFIHFLPLSRLLSTLPMLNPNPKFSLSSYSPYNIASKHGKFNRKPQQICAAVATKSATIESRIGAATKQTTQDSQKSSNYGRQFFPLADVVGQNNYMEVAYIKVKLLQQPWLLTKFQCMVASLWGSRIRCAIYMINTTLKTVILKVQLTSFRALDNLCMRPSLPMHRQGGPASSLLSSQLQHHLNYALLQFKPAALQLHNFRV